MKNVGSGIIFICKDKILLLKNNKNIWEIPGGRKDSGEKFIDTARRETTEEIGFCPEFKKIGYFMHEKTKYKFKIYFGIVKEEFNCNLSDEHNDYKWATINNLPQRLHNKILGALEFLKESYFNF